MERNAALTFVIRENSYSNREHALDARNTREPKVTEENAGVTSAARGKRSLLMELVRTVILSQGARTTAKIALLMIVTTVHSSSRMGSVAHAVIIKELNDKEENVVQTPVTHDQSYC